jgi:hypothetical protein
MPRRIEGGSKYTGRNLGRSSFSNPNKELRAFHWGLFGRNVASTWSICGIALMHQLH